MLIRKKDGYEFGQTGGDWFVPIFSREDREIMAEVVRLSAVVDVARKKRWKEDEKKGLVPGLVCAADVSEELLEGEEELRKYLESMTREAVKMLKLAYYLGQEVYAKGFALPVDALLDDYTFRFDNYEDHPKDDGIEFLLRKCRLTLYLQLALLKLG